MSFDVNKNYCIKDIINKINREKNAKKGFILLV